MDHGKYPHLLLVALVVLLMTSLLIETTYSSYVCGAKQFGTTWLGFFLPFQPSTLQFRVWDGISANFWLMEEFGPFGW